MRAHRTLPLLVFLGCGEGSPPPPPPVADPPPASCARDLNAIGSVSHSVPADSELEIDVVLRDRCLGPVAGVSVEFAFAGHPLGAMLLATSVITDADGVAHTSVSTGSTPGSLTIAARHPGTTAVEIAVDITAPSLPVDDAVLEQETLPVEMICESTQTAVITMRNAGTSTWSPGRGYALAYSGSFPLPERTELDPPLSISPGAIATFSFDLVAPTSSGTYALRFQMMGGSAFGAIVAHDIDVTGCEVPAACDFPQGLPDEDFIDTASSYDDTDPAVDDAVNQAMVELTGCSVGSHCPIVGLPGGNAHEVCQSWFAVVTQKLRDGGFCAGQHEVGSTDEIAVSSTGCGGRWYGYHVCYYGGPSVVWNPGARRGWWRIREERCDGF